MSVIANIPLQDYAKALVLDVRVFEAGQRLNRNVLSARNAIKPANFITDQTLTLKGSASPSGNSQTLQGTQGNTITLVSASAPLRARVTRDTGVLDLGLQTLLVLTSPILSLELLNESPDDVDVEIIHA